MSGRSSDDIDVEIVNLYEILLCMVLINLNGTSRQHRFGSIYL
ncbi:PQQ enzyme repeat family protein [Brugia malayi]|uniref:BMA-DYF-14, isoform e n=2 Tax=Brugia TaxID=6278 RepID=A0A1P6BZ90_BRUMA|nr:PQQ enzyme repeat family protein [Brugia malayi]CDQ01167.1 BMA-DYF-14, isoform e [Brugia malayi]VDO20389.1 unnamed protein product [Brugia timori]VIO94655.1 PQQ enzyme repeat family protein [Brugia malayi]